MNELYIPPKNDLKTVKVALMRPQGDILLLTRSQNDSHRPGAFDLPGGEVDAGELMIKAAVREVAEETGIRVTEQELRLGSRNRARSSYGHVNDRYFFLAEVSMPFPIIQLNPNEHEDYIWASPEEAITLLPHPKQRQGLAETFGLATLELV